MPNQTNNHKLPRRLFLQGTMAVAAGALVRTRLVQAATGSAFPALQSEQVVDVTDPRFGAVGDGVTNDRAAFQAAIDFAIARRRTLVIPPPAKAYRIVLDTKNDRLLINGRLTVRGAGRQNTLLSFGLDSPDPTKNYSAFYVQNGYNVEFSGFRMEEDARPTEFEFMGIHFEAGPAKHRTVVESVDIDGFTHCIYCPSGGSDAIGELFLTIRGCDLSPERQYCVAFWTAETGHKRLHMFDSYLHDNTFSHLVYCHPHNSVHVENCRFDGATSWAFQFQGSTVSGDPEYQRFIGCWFGPRNSRGIITQKRKNTDALVEIRNSVFEGRPAVQIRSDIVIDGCYFTTPPDPLPGSNFVGAYDEAPWTALISNCIFALRTGANPAIDLRLDGIEATVENCQFYCQTSSTVLALGGSDRSLYSIASCLFYTRPGEGNQTKSFEINDGQIAIRSCRFVGAVTGDRGLFTFSLSETGPGPQARLQIDDCQFNSISGGNLFYVMVDGPDSWSNRIFGSNNRITNLITAKPLLIVEPAGTPVYAHLNPVAAPAPLPLTAASVLVITSNFDRYEIQSSADVTHIHWWSPDGLSDPLFSGVVTFAATTGFTLVSGGNIDLGGATSHAVTAGTEVRLFYESADGTWTIVAN